MDHHTELPTAQHLTGRPVGRRRLLLPAVIALVGFVINVVVATSMADTTDEWWGVHYGVVILHGSADRSDPLFEAKMPVSVFNALPLGISSVLRRHGWAEGLADKLRDFRAARYATIVASFLLCLLIYIYTEALFGRVAGLFAQLIYVMSPNLIAHGTLATYDLYISLATILFLYCLRGYLLSPSPANAALVAFTAALAQLAKFSGLFLYAVLLVAIVTVKLYSRFRPEQAPRITGRQIATLASFTVVCFVVVINAGFLFDRPFTPLARYVFISKKFQRIQQIPILREVPLPLPYPYVQGEDMLFHCDETAILSSNIVLLDEVRGHRGFRGMNLTRFDGWASYYLISYALKEPLGMQVLLLLGLLWVVRHRRFADFLTGEWLLLLTAVLFLSVLSFFNNTQIGFRHALPVLAIFVILAGGAFAAWPDGSRWQRLLLGGCLVWTAISVASYFPHMIPYFNEIVTDRKMAYHYLADSSLEWGQDRWVVEAFLKKNPDVVLDPPRPISGRVLVGGRLIGGLYDADYWLRLAGLKPVAQVGFAHFLFDIPAQK